MEVVKKDLAYLGKEFQLKLLSRVIHNPTFSEEILDELEPKFFDINEYKIILIKIKNYFSTYKNLPNCDNLKQIINNEDMSETERQLIIENIDRMYNYKKQVESGKHNNDYDYIESTYSEFIKIQEIHKELSSTIDKLENGDLTSINELPYKFQKIIDKTEKKDYGSDVFDSIESVLEENYRNPIPTGIDFIDIEVGGLGKGEFGLLLMAQGVGKTTTLSYMANHAQFLGYNVLQVIFDENKIEDIKLKHFTKWTGTSSKLFSKMKKEIIKKINDFRNNNPKMGKLIIKKFVSEGMTVPKLRNWINNYQKRYGLKFDIIFIDYMDELESHKDKQYSAWDGEIQVAKALQSLAAELNVPLWSAVQAKKEANHKRDLDKTDAGGSVAKIKKAQLIISAGRDMEQEQENLANFGIVKCNFARAGRKFEDCVLNNELMRIELGRVSQDTLPDFDSDETPDPQEQQQIVQNQRRELEDIVF